MPQNFWKISFQFMLMSVALMVGDALMDGVKIESSWYALLTAAVLMLLNQVVKPILVLLTIPATLFTFGFFILVINAMILLLAGKIVTEFHVDGFWSAFWLSIFLSLVQLFFGNNNAVKLKVSKPQNQEDVEDTDYEEVD
jgi:putative membrane protein